MDNTPLPNDESRTEVRQQWTRSLSIMSRFPLAGIFASSGAVVYGVKPDSFDDVLRCVQIAGAAYIVMFSVVVVVLHAIIATKLRSSETKLLPAHVSLIAASYVCFVVGLTLEVIFRLDEPVSGNILPVALLGDVLGITALAFIWKLELMKARRAGAKV